LIRFIILILIFSQSVFADSPWCGLKLSESVDEVIGALKQEFNCPECKQVRTVCPLNKIKNLPKIIMVGENHYDESSKGTRSQLFELASEGKIEIATEVRSAGNALPWMAMPSSHVHGIESPVPAAVTSSYLIQKMNVEREDLAGTFATIAMNIEGNPLFRGAFESMRKKGSCSECIQKLDAALKYAAVSSDPSAVDSTKEFEKLVSSMPEKKLRDFLTEFHVEAIDIANAKFPEHFDHKLSYLKTTDDLNKVGLPNKLLPLENQTSTVDVSFLNMRNRDFVTKISEILCRPDASGAPLVILVGDGHAAGVTKLLQGLSGDKADIKYFKSYDPTQAVNLIFELQSSR
jgi:hypothetical protein